MADTDVSTASDLMAMGSDSRCELIQGTIVEHPFAPMWTNLIQGYIHVTMHEFVRMRNLGFVSVLSCGFWVEFDPDTVVTPDIGFVARDRMPRPLPDEYFLSLRPDLVAEVVSPIDDPGYIELKRATYERIQVPLVWWIDPQRESATVHIPDRPVQILDRGGALDGGDILPGFSLALAELFDVPKSR